MQTNVVNTYNYLSYDKIDPCNNSIFEYNSTPTTFQKIAYSPTLNRYVLKTNYNILYSNDGIRFYIAQQNGSDFITDYVNGYVKWIGDSINKFFITNTRTDPRSKTTQTVYYSSDGITWINSTVNGMNYQFCPNYISYSPDLNTIILTGSGNGKEGLWESIDGGVTFNMNVTNTNNGQTEFLPDWEGEGIFPVTWDSNLNKFILITQSGNYTGRIFYNTSNTLSNNWTKITPVYDYNDVQLTNINYTFYDIAYSSTLKRTVIVGNRLLYSDYSGDNTNIANLFFKETRNINDTETSGISYKSVIWDSTNEYFIACGDANNSIIYSSDGINWYHNNIATSYPNNYLTSDHVALAMGSNKLVLISENTIIQTDSRYYLSEYIYLNNNGKLTIDTNILSSKSAFIDEALIAQNIYTNDIKSNGLLIGNDNIKVDTVNNRVGIGIGNPTDTLYIKSDATDNCYLKLDAKQNYETGIIFSRTHSNNVNYERFKMYYDSVNDLIISQNSNLQVFKVDNTGNIELGLDKNSITNNLGKLTVGNDTMLENTTMNGSVNIGKNLTMVNEQIIGEIGSIYGEVNSDQFGWSVSLSEDGTIVAIGGIYNDGNGGKSGHVRVYQYSNLSWTQLGSDIDGENSNDQSGVSVSLSSDGTILAVGALFNDAVPNDSGHVRVFQYTNSSWTQLGADIDGEAANDQSGWSVSLSSDGTILAVGGRNNDGNGNNAGHTKVYQWNSSIWQQLGADIDGEAANDQSGWSVSLSSDGTILAIGAVKNDENGSNSGHARVYQWNGSIWSQLGSDINGEAGNDHSGWSVSLSSDGTIIAIGAIYNDGNGGDSGHVRVYRYSFAEWSQIGSDINGEVSGDRFGHSVSLSNDGNRLLVGGIHNDVNGSNSGHARLFENINSSWSQLDNDIDGSATNDQFGYSVSLSGNGKTIAVGGPYYDHTGNNFGIVKLYKYDYKSANINNVTIANGIVTATKFVGDGSLLTGISGGGGGGSANLNGFSDVSFGNVDISGALNVNGNIELNNNYWLNQVSGIQFADGTTLESASGSSSNVPFGTIETSSTLVADLTLLQSARQSASSVSEEADTFYKWEETISNDITYDRSIHEEEFEINTTGQYSIDILLRTAHNSNESVDNSELNERAIFYGFVRHYKPSGIYYDYTLQGHYYRDNSDAYDSLAIGGQVLINFDKDDFFKIGIRTMEHSDSQAKLWLSRLYSKVRIEKLNYSPGGLYNVDISGNLTVGGNMYVTGSVISNTSDDRLKSYETDVSNATNTILKLKPKFYKKHPNLITDDPAPDLTDVEHFDEYGFIAQELIEDPVLSHFAKLNPQTDIYHVNYIEMIPLLVQTIKELNYKVVNLEAENTIIKNALNQLLSDAGKPTI